MTALVAGLGLGGSVAVHAATFVVNGTADAVDAAPGDGTCASAAATCTLRAAVQEANALAGADVVTLPAGTFRLTLVGAGEDLAATGDLDVLQPLTINGAGRDATIVDGVASDRVFQVTPGNAFTLSGLTVRNGIVASAGGGVAHLGGAPLTLTDTAFRNNQGIDGGGVSAANAALVITGSVFENNLAGSNAGAVDHASAMDALDVRDTTFLDNVALSGAGGAIRYSGGGSVSIASSTFIGSRATVGGSLLVASTAAATVTNTLFEDSRSMAVAGAALIQAGSAVVRDSVFRRNVADADYGALLVTGQTGVTMTGSTIEDNRGLGGGGFGGGGLIASAGDVVVEDTVVRGNATQGIAGGLFASASGAVTATRLTIEGNQSGNLGGGAFLTGTTSATLAASRITGNTAGTGVGGGLYVASSGPITVIDTTVSDNTMLQGAGGGAYLAAGTTLLVDRCTVAGNTAIGVGGGVGGGLLMAATTSTDVRNSTISGNLAQANGGGLYVASVATTLTNCTLAGNETLATGAAIQSAAAGTTLRATVVASTAVASCAGLPITSAGDNVDQDGSCALAGPRDRSGLDPQLGPLQDNGGPTPTREPLPGSPLIDGVGDGVCPATDQRGVARPTDGNGDGTAACDVGAVEFVDECPGDPAKRLPGICGCGVPDDDANANGAVDCLINAELKARITTGRTILASLTGDKTDAQAAARTELTALADGLLEYCTTNEAVIVTTSPDVKLLKLAKKARKALRAARKGKGAALRKKQVRGGKALDALDGAVAPQA